MSLSYSSNDRWTLLVSKQDKENYSWTSWLTMQLRKLRSLFLCVRQSLFKYLMPFDSLDPILTYNSKSHPLSQTTESDAHVTSTGAFIYSKNGNDEFFWPEFGQVFENFNTRKYPYHWFPSHTCMHAKNHMTIIYIIRGQVYFFSWSNSIDWLLFAKLLIQHVFYLLYAWVHKLHTKPWSHFQPIASVCTQASICWENWHCCMG